MILKKYETPSMDTLSLENENIICASSDLTPQFVKGNDDSYENAGSIDY